MIGFSFSSQYTQKATDVMRMINGKVKSHEADGVPRADTLDVESEVPSIAVEVGLDKQVSSSSNEYIVDEENYVLIRGKYYKARADNKYLIDGETVFYVNNRFKSKKEKEKEIVKVKVEGPRAVASKRGAECSGEFCRYDGDAKARKEGYN